MVTNDTHALFHAIESNDIEIFMHIFALTNIDVNIKDKICVEFYVICFHLTILADSWISS